MLRNQSFSQKVKKLVVFHHFLVVMKEFMKGNKKAEKQLEQLQHFVWLFIQITNTIFFAVCWYSTKMLENHDLPLTGNFVSKFWLLLFDYRPWEVFWHKKKFFGKVTNLRILLSKILLLGRVFNKNCCLWEKASFYLCFEKKSCWGSCLCSSSFHGALLFSFHTRLFLISADPNISDTISSSLTKCGGWGKKWLQLLKCESVSQTRSGFRKGPVPVSFHLGILILDSM